MPNRFAALTIALVIGIVAIPQTASAAAGTITLSAGDSVTGDILELVPGDHVSIRLQTGQVRIVAWSQLTAYQFQGSVAITVGPQVRNPPPANNPPPPQTTQPPPANNPPPPATYQPPPPNGQPEYYPPPPPPSRVHIFRPRFEIGARLSTESWGGHLYKGAILTDPNCDPASSACPTAPNNFAAGNYVSNGGALELEIGYHFIPWANTYLSVEFAALGNGSFNSSISGAAPWEFAAFVGVNGTTNPRGLGMYFDVATGYRSLSVPNLNYGWDSTTLSGWEILRIGLGVSYDFQDRFRLDAYLWGSFGVFDSMQESSADCSYNSDACVNLTPDTWSMHYAGGLAVAAHLDLF